MADWRGAAYHLAMEKLFRLLAAARRTGAVLADAPTPLSLSQGYEIAARVVAELGTPVGWKIGATSAGAMAVLGVAEPIWGRVFADGLLASGARLTPPGTRPVAAEPEIVLYAGGDGRAVSARLAIEIVRPSRNDALALGPGFIVADNAAHVGLVIGPELPVAALERPEQVSVTLLVNGKPHHSGTAADVLGDPRRALAWLAGAVGGALKAGQPVASGAITRAVELAAGDTVMANFGTFGWVGVTIG